MGLWTATAVVVGRMIGSGVLLLFAAPLCFTKALSAVAPKTAVGEGAHHVS